MFANNGANVHEHWCSLRFGDVFTSCSRTRIFTNIRFMFASLDLVKFTSCSRTRMFTNIRFMFASFQNLNELLSLHTHVLSVSRIARTDPRPATSVSERGASRSGLSKKWNWKIQKLTFTINMIPNRAQLGPGMLFLSLSLFMPTNQNVSSYKTRWEFAFSRRPKSLS